MMADGWLLAGQHMCDRHDRIIEMMRLKSISSFLKVSQTFILFLDYISVLLFIFRECLTTPSLCFIAQRHRYVFCLASNIFNGGPVVAFVSIGLVNRFTHLTRP